MTAFARSKSQGKKKGAKKPVEKSRKEIRKDERKRKKLAKAEYFQKRKEFRSKAKSELEAKDEQVVEKRNAIAEARKPEEHKKQRAKEKKERESQKKQAKQRKLQLEQENLKEDRLIKRLEKQLKLNKRKKKSIPKSFAADGLDYLLDFCVEENRKCAVEAEMQLARNEADTGFEEDLTMLTGEGMPSSTRTDEEDEISDEDVEDEHYNNDSNEEDADEDLSLQQQSDNDSDSYEEMPPKKERFKKRKTESSSSKIHESKEDENDELSDKESIVHVHEANEDNSGVWEDIYGRKRDQAGNVIQDFKKYIPPAARTENKNSNANDQKYIALKKKLKGCINRLAEHNMHSLANQIDELYMSNSRNDMNELICQLMFEALIAPVMTPDRLISEHIMLIAVLHANVGTEVGAHFLEVLVKKCVEMLNQPQDVENKEIDNVISMISHLYNFKVYGHELLYQILERLLEKFTEKEIELILLILRTVGFPLRKDDPIALKEFIQKVQQKGSEEKVESSRVKFMLDVLLAIKNNNVNKIPQYDPSHTEHLKKVVKSVIRKGNTITQFSVSLEDLLHADERGKWWVVGSAWSGSKDLSGPAKTSNDKKLAFGQDVLELARKQRMNTDTRKNIFCVLMTAEDYLDAFEKLHHLGLKNNQEREVVHVIMHCCLQEKNFNPYYAVLAQKFCEYDRKYQLTIQYTLWDKLKTLDTYTSSQLCNLARFLIHLFIQKSLAFSILKVIQFAELDKQTMRLVRQIMLGVLLHEDEDACLQVFERIAVSPQLQNFRESLRLFINHFLIKKIDTSKEPSEKEVLLKRRAVFVDKILTSKNARIVF